MKNFLNLRFYALFLVIISISAASCTDDNAAGNPLPVPSLDQIISQSPDYSSFNTALVRTSLNDDLATGTYTVFVPDNAAFIASGISDVNAVPLAKLDSIVKYHIYGQIVKANVYPASDTLKTTLGRNIFASNNANGLFANGLKLKQTDVVGANGVIHVISKVLTPPTSNIIQIASADTNFTFLVAAITKLNLVTALSGAGKYTVFAPTNAAFRAAGITDINAIPMVILDAIIKYHVLNTNVFSSDFINSTTKVTLQGGTVTLSTTPSAGVKITGSAEPFAGITSANIVATNGVIHVINRAMLP